ncbi:MAG: hypothetical protein E6713_16895, partial [Sporomusaceae bacterium]|nr:hypothetical protein [Sporomusaceae bacterium]
MRQTKNVRLAIDDVQAGMKLGQVVVERDSQIALMEGMLLTDSLIARLKSRGITHLVIEKSIQDNEITRANRLFHKAYDELIPVVKQAFVGLRSCQELSLPRIQDFAQTTIATMVNSVGVMNHLLMVRRQDDYTFHHSLNVSVICGVLGRWLGYEGKELDQLILA